jgi:hypothetical protein
VGWGKLLELLGARRIAEVRHQVRHGRRAEGRAKLVRKRLEMALDEFHGKIGVLALRCH